MKRYWLAVVIVFSLLAACDTLSPPPGGLEAPDVTTAANGNPIPNDVCPKVDPWTKIDASAGVGEGEFGSFSYSDTTLNYTLNEGYVLEFCVKSGRNVGTIYEEVSGSGTITIVQEISHVSWRVVSVAPPKKLIDLTVSKGAETSYERTVEWALAKTVDGQASTSFSGKPGNTFSATWEVVATKTKDEESGYTVFGAITIGNPNPVAVTVGVSDVLDDGTVATVNCSGLTVPAGESRVCPYTAYPEGRTATLNTVSVTVDEGSYAVPAGYTGEIKGATATAEVGWGAPNLIGDPNPLLEDHRPIFGYSQNIGDAATLIETETFTCPAYSAETYPNDTYTTTETNTATLTGNTLDLSASAKVDISCKVTWKNETATGKGNRWSAVKGAPATWFMYTPFTTEKVDLIAGQYYDAGDVTMTRNGTTGVTITLHYGFRFANVTNNVKIHPLGTPASYIQPGAYTVKRTASGTSITLTGLPNTTYYAVHVDVQRFVP